MSKRAVFWIGSNFWRADLCVTEPPNQYICFAIVPPLRFMEDAEPKPVGPTLYFLEFSLVREDPEVCHYRMSKAPPGRIIVNGKRLIYEET